MIGFLKKNKELLINLLITFTFATIITLSMCNSKTLNYDTIWGFHSAQKVANGYTMYTEINTVLTPVFFWMGALFIKLFGNAITSLYIFSGIIGGVLITTIYNILRKIDKEKIGILFLAFMCFALKNTYILAAPSYNILALMLWFLAIYLEIINNHDSKKYIKNNILIGVLTGLIIFTKQNIGVFAFVSTILISFMKKKLINNSNVKNEILAKICGVLIVCLGILIYLIFTNSFIQFVNYCIGGLLDFGVQNNILKFPILYVGIIILGIFGFQMANKKQDKNLMILAISQLCMISFIFPVLNTYHLVLSMFISVPLFGAVTKYLKSKEKYKIIFMMFAFYILCIQKASNIREYSTVENLFMTSKIYASEIVLTTVLICFGGFVISILFEKEKIPQYFAIIGVMFLLTTQVFLNSELRKNEKLPVNLLVYKDLYLNEDAVSYLENVLEYISNRESEGKNVLVASVDASYYMAPLEKNNYIYDFPLYGSLGIQGERALVDKLTKDDNLIILKNKHMMYQESKMLDEFIKENFQKVDEIYDLEVYQKNNQKNL